MDLAWSLAQGPLSGLPARLLSALGAGLGLAVLLAGATPLRGAATLLASLPLIALLMAGDRLDLLAGLGLGAALLHLGGRLAWLLPILGALWSPALGLSLGAMQLVLAWLSSGSDRAILSLAGLGLGLAIGIARLRDAPIGLDLLDPVLVGLLLLAAALAWFNGRREAAAAGLLGLLLALGPLLPYGLPGPALLLERLGGDPGGWGLALAPALGLLLAQISHQGRGIFLLGAIGLFGLRTFAWQPDPVPTPRAARALVGGPGAVLFLPSGPDSAVPQALLRPRRAGWLLFRREAFALTPVEGPRSEYVEPLVVLALDLAVGEARWLLPARPPGQALGALGFGTVVLDRAALPEAGLAVLDPLLRRVLGTPARDLVAGWDLYGVPPTQPVEGLVPVDLIPATGPGRPGWDSMARWFAGFAPEAPPPSPPTDD